MQLVKQSRLSVSKVSTTEWNFILSLLGDADAESSSAEPGAPQMPNGGPDGEHHDVDEDEQDGDPLDDDNGGDEAAAVEDDASA